MTFDDALTKVIELEGGLVLHKNPTEEVETYAGIYRKAFPAWAGWKYIDKGEKPPFELVKELYKKEFWDKVGDIASNIVKYLVFEYSVNAGITKAKMIANAADPNYEKITDQKDVKLFVYAFTIGRIMHYTDLANKNPKKYNLYLRGWINRALGAIKWA